MFCIFFHLNFKFTVVRRIKVKAHGNSQRNQSQTFKLLFKPMERGRNGNKVTKHNNNNGGTEQSLVLRMMYTVTDSKIRIYYYSVTIYKNR